MSGRRFLFVAYHFPPIGGAGVQRAVHVCRHLPALGYEPVVVTGPDAPEYQWTPRDAELGAGSAPAVHRLPGPEPARSGRWWAPAERWARVPTPWRRWWNAHALTTAVRAGRDCDLVYASIAPYQTAEAAARIARALGKPLVVDLEDPWALDEMMVYPTGLHRRLELARMRRALGAADAVIMNTEEAARAVRRAFPELGERLVVGVPNRFDADDFRDPLPARADERFRIVHTGSLHTDLGRRHREASGLRRRLGGALPGVDFLTRSHVFLLEALERLARERPELAAPVELHLAGMLTDADRDAADGARFVHLHGFLPHRETTRLVRTADLLFLPMHDVGPAARARLVPQKTYEYVASGRPILAAVPDGDARDLLARTGSARLCRPADVEAMAEAVADAVERWRAGRPGPEPDPAVVERYESRRLAGDVAAIFDRVLGSERGAYGVAPAGASSR